VGVPGREESRVSGKNITRTGSKLGIRRSKKTKQKPENNYFPRGHRLSDFETKQKKTPGILSNQGRTKGKRKKGLSIHSKEKTVLGQGRGSRPTREPGRFRDNKAAASKRHA